MDSSTLQYLTDYQIDRVVAEYARLPTLEELNQLYHKYKTTLGTEVMEVIRGVFVPQHFDPHMFHDGVLYCNLIINNEVHMIDEKGIYLRILYVSGTCLPGDGEMFSTVHVQYCSDGSQPHTAELHQSFEHISANLVCKNLVIEHSEVISESDLQKQYISILQKF